MRSKSLGLALGPARTASKTVHREEPMSKIGLRKNELDTPALWVDLDALQGNIRHLADTFAAAGVQWRPHVKGFKVPAIAHQVVAAGAIGLTCAKLGEAETMAAAGIRDLLIANQIVGPAKIARLVHLCRHADVKVAVDQAANVAELGRAARAIGVELGVVVELDVGMRRAGIAPGQPAVELSRAVHGTPGLRYLGLMGWEGHVRRVAGLAARRPVIEEAIGLLTGTAELCRAAGLPVSIVSAGGTGTYYVTAHLPGVTEIQAGGAIFGDAAARTWGVDTNPALFLRTTITSRPAGDRIIVDAGFKTMPQCHQVPQPVGLSGVKAIASSAEHSTLTLEEPSQSLKVGDALDFLVGYSDETVFLHDELYGVRDEVVETVWPIRAQGQSR
jgi:D-serine deaminase-like pyridoxal phosphate-dependent protein